VSTEDLWWDAGAKAPPEKPELEAKVEARFVRGAKKRNWKTRKLNGAGARDWPDRLVLAPGVLCLIEFKREKYGKLSPGQELFHESITVYGLQEHTLITTSAEEAIEFVESLCQRSHPENTKKKP
jgi:hypothetical protein